MIQKKSYSTYKELLNEARNNRFIIYGDPYDCINRFESISLPELNYTFGLIYYNLGIESQIHVLDDAPILLIGFEDKIIAINYRIDKELLHEKYHLFMSFLKRRTVF